MIPLKRLANVMDHPLAYRLWQAPFANAKFAPIARHNDLATVQRILDVGCGPGTNVPMFPAGKYMGIDLNRRYIELARQRHPGEFRVADVRTLTVEQEQRFDFILLNSLLHHIDTDNVRHLLGRLRDALSSDGHLHILDLVLPARNGIARRLALADRGDFPRPLEEWSELFQEHFDEIVRETYTIGWCGATFWNMVYFKGRARP